MPFVMNFGNFGNFPFGGFHPEDFQPPKRIQKKRKPIGTPGTRLAINLAVTALVGLGWFYLALPPLNPQSEDFYFFLFLLCAAYCASAVFTTGFQGVTVAEYARFVWRQCRIPLFCIAAMLAVIAVGSASSWVVFRAGSYASLLSIESGDFTAEVEEISYDQIPMLDADSAGLLGNRKLGELADMVSQFVILPAYGADATDGALATTQINYQGRPVRVTSLAYGDIIKWFNNRANGLPAYLIIDMVTREAEVIRLREGGMRYTIAEHFGRNLYRHLRFHYPTMMFDQPVFEIDESGVPWWVCSRIVKRVGLFGGIDVKGAVLVNALTGESSYHEEVPNWVDRLYSADIIVQQYNYYGRYHNGFLNSIFGQRDVTVTTAGYNYIAIGDDVYMYTGVTSVASDESNIGFILSNQRTKETRFYSIAGAEEYSAMASAQSQVQQMRYTATFPLLLNIAEQPTYFMALKGQDGLVKMYAMVNVQQYDIVSSGGAVADCEANYRRTLSERGIIGSEAAEPSQSGEETGTAWNGTAAEILFSVLNGTTHYYIRVEGSRGYLDFDASRDPLAVLVRAGDVVSFTCAENPADLPARSIVKAYSLRFDGFPIAAEPLEPAETAGSAAETEAYGTTGSAGTTASGATGSAGTTASGTTGSAGIGATEAQEAAEAVGTAQGVTPRTEADAAAPIGTADSSPSTARTETYTGRGTR